ncbi:MULTISPECIES: cytochrome P450 [unclassified Microbacterium]|uniref:cytochrome P450 n=1 Tax=unclassified Microbacterium TaxID=2609290 RepID=UPI0015FED339|nr:MULTISPECIES: cytochrome P450 [unclassified Microbacterium]MBT2486739.1 cytochrome P450 [Microbacterium sp. ISL-108]
MVSSEAFTVDELVETPWVPWERVPAGTNVVRTERGVEVIGYDASSALLRNTDYSTGLLELFDHSGVDDVTFRDLVESSVNYAEGAAHTRLRAAIGSFFTPARVAGMRDDVRADIDAALDAMGDAADVELVDQLIRDVPARVFARLLGVDLNEHGAFISRISEESVRVFEMDPTLGEHVTLAWTELTNWVDDLIALHTPGAPDSNVIDHLLAQQAAGNITANDIRSALVTLLAASTDTTQILAALMFWSFAENPDQWQRLRENPELASSAVTEAARYRPGDAWIFRVATVDTAIEDVPVYAGDHVFALIGAAHRDQRVFANPDQFDIGRSERMPLNWGVGRHFCMGRMFAVMELEEMLLATTRRWERIEHQDPVAASAAPYLSVQQSLPVRVHRAPTSVPA